MIMIDSEQGMKKTLESLYSYCNEWRLKVNFSKTEIVVVENSCVCDFRFGSEAAAVANEYKYLVINFNYNGRFRMGELVLAEQAKRAMCSLVGVPVAS